MSDLKDFFEAKKEEEIDLKAILYKYLQSWPWYILSVLIMVLLSLIYLKYQTNIYQTNASILVKDKSNNLLSDLGSMNDMFSKTNKIDDEILIIKSLPILTKVIENLNLQTTYFYKTKFSNKNIEYYKNEPYHIAFFHKDSLFNPIFLEVEKESNKNINLSVNNLYIGKFALNQRIKVDENLSIVVKPNDAYFKNLEHIVYVNYYSKELAALNLTNTLSVEPHSKMSNAINLSYKSNDNQKAKDILNEVCAQYFKNSIEDKKYSLINTGSFIKERIILLDSELRDIENEIKNYKQNNKLTDFVTESQIYAKNFEQLNQKLFDAELQLNLVNALNNKLAQTEFSPLPVNQGFNDLSINTSIARYNELAVSLKSLTSSSTELNPERKIIEKTLKETKKSILDGLNNQRNTLKSIVDQTKRENTILESKLRFIPAQEKELREIGRQQQTKEALFLYLLQKREEVAISETTIEPTARLINYAYSENKPISPKKTIVYLSFILLGLIIPTIFIYLKSIFDTKIHNTDYLDKNSDIPNLGLIPILQDNNSQRTLLSVDDRSSAAEALRLIITNLEFVLAETTTCKTILSTSTISGEGKSFISANIASYLAYSGKKVILLGFDLRAPKLHEFFDYENQLGITHYIKKLEITFDDIIIPIEGYDKFDIIHSGLTIPNFVELMKNRRIEELFIHLKLKYDYIIIDSAPVGLVSDTLNLSKYCDTTLFVIRAHYLHKSMLNISNKLFKEKKLPNMKSVLNAVDIKKSSYGYGNSYGYGYGYTYGYGDEENINEKYKFQPWRKEFWKYWIK
jgi:capsular exopolysaccharide synthesis family protein